MNREDYIKRLELELKIKDSEIKKLETKLKKIKEVLEAEVEIEEKSDADEILNKPIRELGLSSRAYSCLVRAQIITVKDIIEKKQSILNCKKNRWPKIRSMGVKTMKEVLDKMKEIGLPLE